jgi:cation diffusion facilitator CzcD-associated flavoprotein CzcO
VVVIGGSQAGLAMAWHLARQHLRFVVLEAGPEPGHIWRSRWDSLTLFTPVQYAALPGMPSAAAAAGSGWPGSGSGPQWPGRTGALSGSPTTAAWTPAP